jgi:hypothetical protein
MKKILLSLTVVLTSMANASTWTLVGQQFLDGHYYCTYRAPNTNLAGADPRLGSPVLTTTLEVQPGQVCPMFINR